MKSKFTVTAAALCGAVTLTVAPVLAQPREIDARGAAQTLHPAADAPRTLTLALPESSAMIPSAAVLAPTTQSPETTAAILQKQPEAASRIGETAAMAGSPEAPNAGGTFAVKAAGARRSAAAEQARAAADDGSVMDGAASAGQGQVLDAAKIQQAYSGLQAKAYAGVRWSRSKPRIGDYSTLPLSDPGVATAYQFSALIPANATYFIIVRTSVIGQPTMFSNRIAFAAPASACRMGLVAPEAKIEREADPADMTINSSAFRDKGYKYDPGTKAWVDAKGAVLDKTTFVDKFSTEFLDWQNDNRRRLVRYLGIGAPPQWLVDDIGNIEHSEKLLKSGQYQFQIGAPFQAPGFENGTTVENVTVTLSPEKK